MLLWDCGAGVEGRSAMARTLREWMGRGKMVEKGQESEGKWAQEQGCLPGKDGNLVGWEKKRWRVGGSSLLSIELWRSKEKELPFAIYVCQFSTGNGGSEAPCGTGFARLLEGEWLPCRQVAYAWVCVSLSLIITLIEFGVFLFFSFNF